jgi:carbon storage regulator
MKGLNMLVLSRKKLESIEVTTPDGTVITIFLCEIRGDKVRIGINAPKDVIIVRTELLEDDSRKKDEILLAH